MRLKLLLPAVLFLGFARVQAQPSQPAPQSAEGARIERLAGLAKVWGAVKYFHPYLAYKEVDWDKALVETIPKVNAAKTPQEYQAAINSMLAVLNDKNTRAEIESESKPESGPNPSPGANGDVTNLVLPGNITVNFTGQSVRHADGRQLQRVGIQPTIRVEPTIRGLLEGRDEVLETAIKFLQPNKTKP
jgi:hypothetical protein